MRLREENNNNGLTVDRTVSQTPEWLRSGGLGGESKSWSKKALKRLSDFWERLLSVIRVFLLLILILIIAGSVAFAYDQTFRNHKIRTWTNGPFGFDCGVYKAVARKDTLISGGNSLILVKHFLAVLWYPKIQKFLIKHLPGLKPPFLISSFLSGTMLAFFGFWLYWRTKSALIAIPIMLLLGFSFMTWYVASILESKALIGLAVFVLLMALDWLQRKTDFLRLLVAIEATVFMWLTSYGSMEVLLLIPLALLTRWRRIGTNKLLAWSGLSLLSVILIFAFFYHCSGNPCLKINEMLAWTKKRKSYGQCTIYRMTGKNFRKIALQSLVYSVGGLKFEAPRNSDPLYLVPRIHKPWAKEKAYRAYFNNVLGGYFLVGYSGLIFICLVIILLKNLWYREPILALIVAWIFLRIVAVIYYRPAEALNYSYYVLPLLWAFIGITLNKANQKKIFLYLIILLIIIVWNNWAIIQSFKLPC